MTAFSEDGTYNYTYDAEGNRTEKYVDENNNDTLDTGDTDVSLYEWDHRNRLVKVTEQNAYGTDTRAISYEYDVFDLRVITHNLSVTTGLAVRTAFYIWDGQQLALQFSDGDGAGPNAPTFTYRFLNGPRIDQVLTQEGTSSTHWLLADHLGTTREVLDNSGNLVRHYVFDAYGNLEGTIANTRILFAGRELDSVTGLYYVRARWYDPSVGRWISEDPIGFSGGDTNLARYVGNSPVNYTDPSGLTALPTIPFVRPGKPPTYWVEIKAAPNSNDRCVANYSAQLMIKKNIRFINPYYSRHESRNDRTIG